MEGVRRSRGKALWRVRTRMHTVLLRKSCMEAEDIGGRDWHAAEHEQFPVAARHGLPCGKPCHPTAGALAAASPGLPCATRAALTFVKTKTRSGRTSCGGRCHDCQSMRHAHRLTLRLCHPTRERLQPGKHPCLNIVRTARRVTTGRVTTGRVSPEASGVRRTLTLSCGCGFA